MSLDFILEFKPRSLLVGLQKMSEYEIFLMSKSAAGIAACRLHAILTGGSIRNLAAKLDYF